MTHVCDKCGHPIAPDDHFCGGCGALVSPSDGEDRAATEDATPPASWWRRRWYVPLAAVVVVLAGAGAALLVLQPEPSTAPQDTRALLVSAHRSFDAAMAPLAGAESIRDLRATRPAILAGDRALIPIARRAQSIDQRKYRSAAVALLAAERQALNRMAVLTSTRPDHLDTFAGSRANAQAAGEQVRAAARPVLLLDLSVSPAMIIPAQGSIATILRKADTIVARAEKRLKRWRRKADKVIAAKRADRAVLNAYASSMRDYLAQYSQLRGDMQAWTVKVDAGDVTYDEAYAFLDQAASSRVSLRDALRTLRAPPGMSVAHVQLLSVISEAVDAVNAAYDGLSDFQFDPLKYDDDYKTTPGWQEFQSTSGRLSGSYDSSLAAWEQGLTAAQKAIAKRKLPKTPSV